MIHTDLDKISLRTFVDVFCGDINAVCDGDYTEKEKLGAAEKLINEYLSIVGGKTITAELIKRNEILNNAIKIDCMNNCKAMIKLGNWKEACEVLAVLGFNMKESEKEKIKQRVESILSAAKFRIDKLNQTKEQQPTMDKDYFVRERVMVMSHFNLHINPDTFSAKEYGFMVKRMCDDVSSLTKSSKK